MNWLLLAAWLAPPLVILPITLVWFWKKKIGSSNREWLQMSLIGTVLYSIVPVIFTVGAYSEMNDFDPPEPTAAQYWDKKCADSYDNSSTDETKYVNCDGYGHCKRQTRLDGIENNCDKWWEWPTGTKAAQIEKEYRERYPEEFRNPFGPDGDSSDPYIPPDNGMDCSNNYTGC